MNSKMKKSLETQVGGTHYLSAYQCYEFIGDQHYNFTQGNILKYMTRHRSKNGAEDLLKVIDYCNMGEESNELLLKNIYPYSVEHSMRFLEANKVDFDEYFLLRLYNGDYDFCRMVAKNILLDVYGQK